MEKDGLEDYLPHEHLVKQDGFEDVYLMNIQVERRMDLRIVYLMNIQGEKDVPEDCLPREHLDGERWT